MNYKKIYDEIITKAKSENRSKKDLVYYEIHHIIPYCMGGTNIISNRVHLTGREHYICHKILIEIYPNIKGLKTSIWRMMTGQQNKYNRISAREYEYYRILNSQVQSILRSGKSTWNKGLTKETDSRVKKQSDVLIGRTSRIKGEYHHSEETLEKLRTSHKGQISWRKGLTKENNDIMKKQSEKMKGQIHSKMSEKTKQKIREKRKLQIFTKESILLRVQSTKNTKQKRKEEGKIYVAWNKGLTKEIDERLKNQSKSITIFKKGQIPWNKGTGKSKIKF